MVLFSVLTPHKPHFVWDFAVKLLQGTRMQAPFSSRNAKYHGMTWDCAKPKLLQLEWDPLQLYRGNYNFNVTQANQSF